MKKLLKIGVPLMIAVMLMGIGGAITLTTDSVWADGGASAAIVEEDVTPGNGWNCPGLNNGTCPGNGPNGECIGDCDGDCDGNCYGYAGNGECPAAEGGTCPGYGGRLNGMSGLLRGQGFCGRSGVAGTAGSY